MGIECSSTLSKSMDYSRHHMSRNERNFLKSALLEDKEFLSQCNKIDDFLNALKCKGYKPGEEVFKYGDKGDILYIIAQGEVACISNEGLDFGTATKGKLLGQFAFFSNKTRSANAKAIKESRIYYIDRKTFSNLMFTKISESKDLNKFDIFYNLDDDTKKKIFPKLQNVYYNTNDVIVKEGDSFNCIYLVTNGSIIGKINGNNSHVFVTNNHFGEVELKNNSKKFTTTYVAAKPSTVMKIPLDVFKSMMPQI